MPFCKHIVANVIFILYSVNYIVKMGHSWSRGGENIQRGHFSSILKPCLSNKHIYIYFFTSKNWIFLYELIIIISETYILKRLFGLKKKRNIVYPCTPKFNILTDKRNATYVTLRNSCSLSYLFQNKFD